MSLLSDITDYLKVVEDPNRLRFQEVDALNKVRGWFNVDGTGRYIYKVTCKCDDEAPTTDCVGG